MARARYVWAAVGAVALGVVVTASAAVVTNIVDSDERQAALAPFYATPSPLTGDLGTVVRIEPLDVEVPGATAQRMLYVTERPDGTRAVSGGMVFIPTAPAPPEGRPVIAWAHGTIGQGDSCAPSRSRNPLQDTANWLDEMMARGWVVVSTDYAGLGTQGPNLYLVGEAEARDVVNSVRAVRSLAEAQASERFIAWGHSQGGHSVLWTGHLAAELAPELDLVAVAAAAPAAELPLIMDAQWNTAAGWAIGPEVMTSWPVVNPGLRADDVMSGEGARDYERLANECIIPAALEGMVRSDVGQTFFSANPLGQSPWLRMAQSQTPAPLPDDIPVLIGQSTADAVVLPWPNARLQVEWCSAGSALDVLWLGMISHQDTAMVMGPAAVGWMSDRFSGRPMLRNCAGSPPVE